MTNHWQSDLAIDLKLVLWQQNSAYSDECLSSHSDNIIGHQQSSTLAKCNDKLPERWTHSSKIKPSNHWAPGTNSVPIRFSCWSLRSSGWRSCHHRRGTAGAQTGSELLGCANTMKWPRLVIDPCWVKPKKDVIARHHIALVKCAYFMIVLENFIWSLSININCRGWFRNSDLSSLASHLRGNITMISLIWIAIPSTLDGPWDSWNNWFVTDLTMDIDLVN